MLNNGIVTDLLDEINDLLLGGIAGDELVNVGHDVHADVACELIPGLREGGGAEDKEGKTEKNLEELTVNKWTYVYVFVSFRV